MTVSRSLGFKFVEIGTWTIKSLNACTFVLLKSADGRMSSRDLGNTCIDFLQLIRVNSIICRQLSCCAVLSLWFCKQGLRRFWMRSITGRPIHLLNSLVNVWVITIFTSAFLIRHSKARTVSLHSWDHKPVFGVRTSHIHLIDTL